MYDMHAIGMRFGVNESRANLEQAIGMQSCSQRLSVSTRDSLCIRGKYLEELNGPLGLGFHALRGS
jgi:hypothetical protein